MKEIVIYPAKFRMVFLAIGAILFFCLGTAIAIWQDEFKFSPLEIFLDTYFVIPIFAICFIIYSYRLFFPKPALIINNQGIYDNASPLTSGGLIGWDEIANIYIYDLDSQRYLGIVPNDPAAFLSRQPFIKRRLMKIIIGFLRYVDLPPAPINIPQKPLPMKVDELLLRIQKFRNDSAAPQ